MSDIGIVTKGDFITYIIKDDATGNDITITFAISDTNQQPSEFVYINQNNIDRAIVCADTITEGVHILPVAAQTLIYIDEKPVTTIGAGGTITRGTVLPIPTPSQSWEQFVFIDI